MPQKSLEEQPECHRAKFIRQNICVNDLPLTKHTDGEHYCLFHLPTENKDIAKFEEIFKTRLNAVKQKVAEIEKLPEAQKDIAKMQCSYDFSYVWFPSIVNLRGYTFEVTAIFKRATFAKSVDFTQSKFEYTSFNSATFIQDAEFTMTTFNKNVWFDNATFTQGCFFGSATFIQIASFRSAEFDVGAHFVGGTFTGKADFGLAKFTKDNGFQLATFIQDITFGSAEFTEDAHFSSTTFSQEALFKETIFTKGAYFDSARFLATSQVSFKETKFSGEVNFQNSVIAGYIGFEGAEENYLFLGNILNLQSSRVEKPERISFQSVRLEPNWFVNIDCKKFVFIACDWNGNLVQGLKYVNDVEKEITALESRKILNPNKLLTRACWQLADNHEESKSFELASVFRQMANESKRLEENNIFQVLTLHWWYYFSSFYGESYRQALKVLLAILFIFAVLYTQSDFQVCRIEKPDIQGTEQKFCETPRGLKFGEAIRHSLATATFQNVEYRKPVTGWSETWIILEKIFAPLQAALLALAIRRKFMR